MAPKAESTKAKSDVKVLKGQDAEDLVLDYMKRVSLRRGYQFLPQPTMMFVDESVHFLLRSQNHANYRSPYGAVDVASNLKGIQCHV